MVGLSGGIVGEMAEYKAEMQKEQEIVDYINGRANSPEFLNYYQGLIRHNHYQKNKMMLQKIIKNLNLKMLNIVNY